MLMGILSACNNDNQTAATPEPAATSTPAPADTSTPPPVVDSFSREGFNPLDYGMEPFANPVTIQIPVFDRARDDVPDVTDNYYTRWINEHFGANMNVTVEFINITRADTMTSYNMLLSGGDWPTVFMEYDWPKVTQWAADGALGTIDVAAFAETAPVWFAQAGGHEMFDMFQLGGEYIFAPAQRPFWDTNYTHVEFYRKDWYEKAGIELFTTYEEFVDALVLFKELGFSDGKHIKPQAAFTANFQFYRESAWPRNEEDWIMHSDVSVAGLPSPGAKAMLKRLNEQYNLGLISTEFELQEASAGGGAVSQDVIDFINGTAYTYNAFLAADMPDLTAFFQNNPDAKLGVVLNNTVFSPWAGADGAGSVPQARATNPAGYFVGFSSRATADELKAAWLYMEWMAQADVLDYMQWGEPGVCHTVAADGSRTMIGWEEQGDYWMGFSNNKDYWAIVVEVRLSGTIEDTIAAITPQGLPQDLTQELIDNYYYLKAAADTGLAYVDPFFAVNIESLNEYAGPLQSLFQELATALVKCDPADFEALYASSVQRYNDAGFKAIADERLAAYRAGKSTVLPDIPAGRASFVEYDPAAVVPRKYTIN
jgi:putative aldouronate transport system substrate-binding protein